ncbi:MAG: DUF3106 domain-containing protein [Casimicrobiaceae bacterium]
MAEAHRELTSRRTVVLAALLLAAACHGTPVLAGPVTLHSPSWAELSPANQAALAPLASQWDQLDGQRKRKWLGIAERYPNMPPAQRQRVQRQMGVWVNLTPDQRRSARERFKSFKQLPPDKRREVREKWQQYQQLPPEKRRELARRGEPGPDGGPRPAPPAPSAQSPAPTPPATQ